MSRRAFLGKGGLALAGVGLLAGWIDSGPAGATQAPAKAIKAIDALPWDSLRQSLGKGLLRPGEAGYASAAMPWNCRYADLLPGGIARCREAKDVQAALLWAQSSRLPVAVRGGGLSAGALSSTRGLMIDLSAMNSDRKSVV